MLNTMGDVALTNIIRETNYFHDIHNKSSWSFSALGIF